jgi:hypothetical protein
LAIKLAARAKVGTSETVRRALAHGIARAPAVAGGADAICTRKQGPVEAAGAEIRRYPRLHRQRRQASDSPRALA